MTIINYVDTLAQNTRKAAKQLRSLSSISRNDALAKLSELLRSNTSSIIEANQKNYKRFESVNYAVTLKLDWIIKGPVGDINKGPYIYFGAISQNKETVLKGEKTIKGLSQIVNNYGQFVV